MNTGIGRIEEQHHRLVQFGGDEVEIGLHLVAPDVADLRQQGCPFGHAVGEELHDGRPLGQHLAVVEHQRRHIAVAVDREVILAGARPVGLPVDWMSSISRPSSRQMMCGESEQAAACM